MNFNKIIDDIFSYDKYKVYLLLILALAFILRLISAINISVTADDMTFVVHAINFIDSGKLVTYHQSSGLWFMFTNLMYNLFGTTQLASRLAAVIFGAFSVIPLYFLTKEFFGKNVALISSFLLAISPFAIKNMMAEMDSMAMFFVLLSAVIYLKGIKERKIQIFMLSGLFMGLAVYTKVYPIFFAISLLLYSAYVCYKENKKIFTKENITFVLAFLAVIFLFSIPAITHNYLLYQEKGFMDLQFTRAFGFGHDTASQYYSWDPIFEQSNFWGALIFGDSTGYGQTEPWSLVAISFIMNGSPAIFWLGVIGLISLALSKKKEKRYLPFFIILTIIAFSFLASIILLSKHFLFVLIFLIPLSAYTINEGVEKYGGKNKAKALKILLIILLAFSLIYVGVKKSGTQHFYGKSDVAQMIEFKEESIGENALIVGDSRFYTGRALWMFYGRPYVNGLEFLNYLSQRDSLQSELVQVQVYFVECARDDCGWGLNQVQGQLNDSMEQLTEQFKQNGQLVKRIEMYPKSESYTPIIFPNEKENTINIYSMFIPIHPEILQVASQNRQWFLYNVGYQPLEQQFDYYPAQGLGKVLNTTAIAIRNLSLALAIASLIYALYLLHKEKNEESILTKENISDNGEHQRDSSEPVS